MSDQLEVTHRTEVTPDQIDHLGHMNVRYYGENARRGGDALLAELGGLPAGTVALVDDHHTHHRAEQMEGNPLFVRSGVVEVGVDSVRLYHELVNADSGVIAATFLHRVRAVDPVNHERVALPDALRSAAGDRCVAVPDHGRPRSLPLTDDHARWAPSPATLLDLDLHIRLPRTITAAETDEHGWYPAGAYAELTWGGEPRTDVHNQFLRFDTSPEGHRLSWAVLESRACLHRLPRAGDRIQSFSALRGLGNKTAHRMQWAMDLERGDPLVTFEVVDIHFDLDARRAAVISDEIRERNLAQHHPELFPG